MANVLCLVSSWPQEPAEARLYEHWFNELAKNQHRVLLVTRLKNAEPKFHHNVQVIEPLKKWSLWEVPKLVPTLMSFKPDAVSILQPNGEDLRFAGATLPLVQVAKSLFQITTLVHLFHFGPEIQSQRKLIGFLQQADVITVANHFQKTCLIEANADLQVEVVPPLAPEQTQEDLVSRQETLWLEQAWSHYWFVPGPMDSHHALLSLFSAIAKIDNQDQGLIFVDGWGKTTNLKKRQIKSQITQHKLSDRVLVVEGLGLETRTRLFQSCEGVLLATLNNWSPLLSLECQTVLANNKACIMRQSQMTADSFNWEDQVTCLLSGKFEGDLEKLEVALSDDSIRNQVTENLRLVPDDKKFDRSGNQLSRLFSR